MPQPPILVTLDPPWPRYRLICGVVKRLLSPEAVEECLRGRKWVEEKHLN
jgi:hypothetical protein